MLKELNKALQKFNKNVSIPVNRLNALNKARKGDTKSLEKIIENKVKNKGFNLLKKLL
jgi:hypothetical protein